ncbi:hypothetical protein DIM_25930 [Candidatus Denitrolinea symbiosum]|nr:hypothetical protein DIM_25930 [Candidatus Denitrolinea symbiosum]
MVKQSDGRHCEEGVLPDEAISSSSQRLLRCARNDGYKKRGPFEAYCHSAPLSLHNRLLQCNSHSRSDSRLYTNRNHYRYPNTDKHSNKNSKFYCHTIE